MFENVTPILGNIQDRSLKSSVRESFAAAFMKAGMNQIAQAGSSTGWLLRSTSKNKLNTSTHSVPVSKVTISRSCWFDLRQGLSKESVKHRCGHSWRNACASTENHNR